MIRWLTLTLAAVAFLSCGGVQAAGQGDRDESQRSAPLPCAGLGGATAAGRPRRGRRGR